MKKSERIYKRIAAEREVLMENIYQFQALCDEWVAMHIFNLGKVNSGGYTRWAEEYFWVKEMRDICESPPYQKKKYLVEAVYEILKKDLSLEGGKEIYTRRRHRDGDIHIRKNDKMIWIRIKHTLDNRPWETEIRDARSRNRYFLLLIMNNETREYVKREVTRGLGRWTFVKMDIDRNGDSRTVMDNYVDSLVARVREIIDE